MKDQMTSLYEQIKTLWAEFDTNHAKHFNGNKAAGMRARKSLGELKKLVTEYRRISIELDKEN